LLMIPNMCHPFFAVALALSQRAKGGKHEARGVHWA
jgi:hypothetical protein